MPLWYCPYPHCPYHFFYSLLAGPLELNPSYRIVIRRHLGQHFPQIESKE